MGNAGFVILYVMTLVGVSIMGLYFTLYAARCLLVIVDQTAAGNDVVVWPDEPVYDWLGQGFHLVWLLVFSFVPAWALSTVLAEMVPETIPWQWVIFLSSVWLIFPICLLSTLTGPHRWAVLHPQLLVGALYHFFPMLFFYLLTGLFLAAAGFVVFLSLSGAGWNWVFLSPVVFTFVWFLYGRLVGRVAFLISHRPPPGRQRAEKDNGKTQRRAKSRDLWATDAEEEDSSKIRPNVDLESEDFSDDEKEPDEDDLLPDDMPILEDEEEEDEWTMNPKPYGVIQDDNRKDWWERKTRSLTEDPGTYDVVAEETASSTLEESGSVSSSRKGKNTVKAKPSIERVSAEELERALELRRRGPKELPKTNFVQLFFVGVYQFPWYPSSWSAWGYLTFLGVVLSIFIRCMQLFQPY